MLAMMRACLTAALVAAPAAAAAMPQSATVPWLDQRPQARGERLLRATMLTAHNVSRRHYGAAPLVWDEGLARDAAGFAAYLARTGRFHHARQPAGPYRQGENLWTGTRGAYSYGEMIGLLIDERRHFRPGRFPAVSRTGHWSHVGHFTQIVWPSSQRVGCASASNRSNEYLVCRYWPAGNQVGVYLR